MRQPLAAPPRLNQTWALDFMTETLYDGRRVRLLTMIDEGNREGLEIVMGLSVPSRRVTRALDELVAVHGCASALRVDNGTEETMAATWFVYRPNWFVLAQTDGKPLPEPEIPEWNKDLALAALDVAEIPFDHTDGNCMGFARERSIAIKRLGRPKIRPPIERLQAVEGLPIEMAAERLGVSGSTVKRWRRLAQDRSQSPAV